MRAKSQSTWYIYSESYLCYYVHEDDIKFKTQSRQKTQKTQEDETVQTRLNKIMTARGHHMKYNFVAPLNRIILPILLLKLSESLLFSDEAIPRGSAI